MHWVIILEFQLFLLLFSDFSFFFNVEFKWETFLVFFHFFLRNLRYLLTTKVFNQFLEKLIDLFLIMLFSFFDGFAIFPLEWKKFSKIRSFLNICFIKFLFDKIYVYPSLFLGFFSSWIDILNKSN